MTYQAPILPAAPLDGAPLTAASPEADSAPPPRSGDRWTPARMADFLRQLSATHSVSAAAKSVGMSRQSAYRLRSRLKDEAFDLAWEVAFHHSYNNLGQAALDRALNGVEVPVYFQGELVGSYRKYDERLTLALLGMRGTRDAPVLGRHVAAAAEHAAEFEALVAEVEELAREDTGLAAPRPRGDI
jgi:hypothetical protein